MVFSGVWISGLFIILDQSFPMNYKTYFWDFNVFTVEVVILEEKNIINKMIWFCVIRLKKNIQNLSSHFLLLWSHSQCHY